MNAPLLEVENLRAFYGDFQALFGIDAQVEAAESVAIIGANGAGKSTFLRCLTGMLATAGQNIRFEGRVIAGISADKIHRRGIAMVPEGRRLFRSLSVEENLLIGATSARRGYWSLEKIYMLFPDLRARRKILATALSGGQQQMVAIGRALMSNPKLLLCDELSLGLAPKVVDDIYAALAEARAQGIAFVFVEQDVQRALAAADRVYCLQEGRITLQGAPADFTPETVADAYFGKREAA